MEIMKFLFCQGTYSSHKRTDTWESPTGGDCGQSQNLSPFSSHAKWSHFLHRWT